MLLLAAGLLAAVPIPAAVVERFYSNLAYPLLQSRLTTLSNRTPFALFDGLIIVVTVLWLLLLSADLKSRRGAPYRWVAWRAVGRTATLAAALYIVFVATWGLHYRRQSLPATLRFDRERVTPSARAELAASAVAELNRLYRPDREPVIGPTVDQSLVRAFDEAQRQLGASRLATPGRPKRSLLLDWYFRRAGVDGMTDPYFLETMVLTDVLPVEQPMIVAHEWAHLAGYADEGEANFVGWLICLQGSSGARYSGWLFLYAEAARGLLGPEQHAVATQLEPGPRADLSAIRDRFVRSVNPTIATAGWGVYDRYLKLNRVKGGTESYGQVVRLVLGTRLGVTTVEKSTAKPATARPDLIGAGTRGR